MARKRYFSKARAKVGSKSFHKIIEIILVFKKLLNYVGEGDLRNGSGYRAYIILEKSSGKLPG